MDGCTLLRIQNRAHKIFHKPNLGTAQHDVMHELEHKVAGIICKSSIGGIRKVNIFIVICGREGGDGRGRGGYMILDE